jgi:hypothetical protein
MAETVVIVGLNAGARAPVLALAQTDEGCGGDNKDEHNTSGDNTND